MRLSDEKSEIRFNLRSHKISKVHVSPLRRISINKLSANKDFRSTSIFESRVIFCRLLGIHFRDTKESREAKGRGIERYQSLTICIYIEKTIRWIHNFFKSKRTF